MIVTKISINFSSSNLLSVPVRTLYKNLHGTNRWAIRITNNGAKYTEEFTEGLEDAATVLESIGFDVAGYEAFVVEENNLQFESEEPDQAIHDLINELPNHDSVSIEFSGKELADYITSSEDAVERKLYGWIRGSVIIENQPEEEGLGYSVHVDYVPDPGEGRYLIQSSGEAEDQLNRIQSALDTTGRPVETLLT